MPSYVVKYKDLETGLESSSSVSGSYATQEDAEAAFADAPKSKGGMHAGLQVIPRKTPAGESHDEEKHS